MRFNRKQITMFGLAVFCVLMLFATGNVMAVNIGDSPAEAIGKPAPPNFMIIIDDSGSMEWSTLNRGSSEGKFFIDGDLGTPVINDAYTNIYSTALQRYWRSKWSGPGSSITNSPNPTYSSKYNAMAYNPNINYKPWYGYSNANKDTPKNHPNGTSTYNLTAQYGENDVEGVSLKRRHYYVWSESAQKAYLINLDGSIKYYIVDEDNSGYIGENQISVEQTSPPADVKVKRAPEGSTTIVDVSYEDEKQNFANWYQYHRTRWLSAVGGITQMLPKFNGVNVGLYSIWGRMNVAVVPIRIKNTSGVIEDLSDKILTPLTAADADVADGTPLRRALDNVGKYYDTTDSGNGGLKKWDGTSASSPIASETNGGACQQNYAMLFTDGYRNTDDYDEFSHIGNSDNQTSLFSGFTPYKDSYSRTLADVAMYYYKRDLSSTLPNKVSENGPDKATHQHMVTYTVGFGLDGQLNSALYDISSGDSAQHPPWPEPVASSLTTIDDLWHAAVNGRGDYISANNTAELEEAFSRIAEDVSSRSGSAASVGLNGQYINEGLLIYQTAYDAAGWNGILTAKKYPNIPNVTPATPDLSKTPLLVWSAARLLTSKTYDNRKIITYTGTTGIPFRYADINTAGLKNLFDASADAAKAENMINYLRGDHSKEVRKGVPGAIFRNREASDETGEYESRLGDIVHSAPVFANDVVYVGSNDGMLHAFAGTASGGNELFAYVPRNVMANLKDLTSPSYTHKYYVDSSPFVRKVGAEYYLVGGLGKGGKGIYCLKVTNAATLSETDAPSIVKWEYPATPGSDANMGFSFSKPIIVNTKAAGWVVIFGNGYNSTNGKAVLYIRDLLTGAEVKTFDTGMAGDNGLSTPNVVDVDADGLSDYVYAGDLKGNMWKFEIRSSSTADWAMAYGTNPLFTAKDASGNVQPVTSRPEAMLHCKAGLPGYMVVFGTGKMLDGTTDNPSTAQQTIYGIWDYGDDADNSEYLGAFNRGTANKLSNQPSTVSLLRQTVAWSGGYNVDEDLNAGELYDKVVVFTNNAITWLTADDATSGQKPNPSGASANHAGWYLDLPNSRERVVNEVIIRSGKAIVVSSIPSVTPSDPCTPTGESWLYELNACTGGSNPNDGHFDLNNDKKVDSGDKLNATIAGATVSTHVSGIHYSKMIYPPAIAGGRGLETLFLGVEDSGLATVGQEQEKAGIIYWRSY